jgi:hypothetical protein
MPTADRRPRRRKGQARPAESIEALHEEARQANGDTGIWDAGLRRRMIRALVDKGHRTEVAEGIARAYERRPMLIPMRAPQSVEDSQ